MYENPDDEPDDGYGNLKTQVCLLRASMRARGMPDAIETLFRCGYRWVGEIEVARHATMVAPRLASSLREALRTHPNHALADKLAYGIFGEAA